MTVAPSRRAALVCGLMVALAGCHRPVQQQHPAPRHDATTATATAGRADLPPLALLTALPIVFGEGFSLDSPPHPAMAALAEHYHVRPVDGPDELARDGLLLAAQPRALTAERLVALDRWVRNGGRMLLLADPYLAWPSDRTLGDRLRPPFAFDDTGLIAHWGLTLTAPADAAPVRATIAGHAVQLIAPGTLSASSTACQVSDNGLRAECRIGRGRVTVIADADWLQVAQADEPANLAALTAILGQLAVASESRTDLSTTKPSVVKTGTTPTDRTP